MTPPTPESTHVTLRRAVAHYADNLIYLLGIAFVLAAAAAISDVLLVIALILAFPGQIAYFVLTQRHNGQSPGKRLARIRVVDERGGVPSHGALLRRSVPLLFEYLYLIALVAMLSSPYRQRLGDRWADTYVVHAEPDPVGAAGEVAQA